MLKLFAFKGAETDWVAAADEAEARRVLIDFYHLDEADVAEGYQSISEVDPGTVKVRTDKGVVTAAAIMSDRTAPFLVCSTCE